MKFKIQSKIIDGEKWFKFDKTYEEKRYFYGNLIMLSLGILTILFMIFLAYYVLTHVNEITENPLVYGLSKLDVEVYCTCSVLGGGYDSFWVNSSHIGSNHQNKGPQLLKFDGILENIKKEGVDGNG